MQIKPIFPTEIGISQLDDKTLIQQLLVIHNKNKNDTGNLWLDTDPAVQQVKQFIEEECNKYATLVGFNRVFKSTRGWIRTSNFSDYTSAHHHASNAFISGCLYLKANGNGKFLMHDPRGSVNWLDIEPKNHSTPKNEYPTEGYTYSGSNVLKISPQTGMLTFFPGWLAHSVEPNLNRESRVCLAFNLDYK